MAQLSKYKANEMIKDGTAHGIPLTAKQKKYFQAVAHGMKPKYGFGGYKEGSTNPELIGALKGVKYGYIDGGVPQFKQGGISSKYSQYSLDHLPKYAEGTTTPTTSSTSSSDVLGLVSSITGALTSVGDSFEQDAYKKNEQGLIADTTKADWYDATSAIINPLGYLEEQNNKGWKSASEINAETIKAQQDLRTKTVWPNYNTTMNKQNNNRGYIYAGGGIQPYGNPNAEIEKQEVTLGKDGSSI